MDVHHYDRSLLLSCTEVRLALNQESMIKCHLNAKQCAPVLHSSHIMILHITITELSLHGHGLCFMALFKKQQP